MAKEGWLELESDPGVFTLLAKALGIKGVQVEEIYDLNKELSDRVHGFIFLFCWSDDRRSRRRQNAIPEDMQIRDERRLRQMFFARQIITNSCATHALLSVVLNTSDVSLGQTLTDFKESTRDMDAESKGLAIGNVPEFADAHNRHSRPEPVSINRAESNGAVLSRSVEAYHYVSYIPIDGHLVELDGLKAHPIDHGPIPEGEDWTVKFRQVMQDRLGSNFGEANQDIRYNLLALVDDRIENCQNRLAELEAQREQLLETVERTFCSLVASPVTSPLVSPSSPLRVAPLSDSQPPLPFQAPKPFGGLSPTALFPVAPSTQALVPEPMVLVAEAHSQPVCESSSGFTATLSSSWPAPSSGGVASSVSAVTSQLRGNPATSSSASGGGGSSSSSVQVTSTPLEAIAHSTQHLPATRLGAAASSGAVADAAGTKTQSQAASSAAVESASSTQVSVTSSSGTPSHAVDPAAVTAALECSLVGLPGSAKTGEYVTSVASPPPQPPPPVPLLQQALTHNLPNSIAAPGLATLAALAPSPVPGSPIRDAALAAKESSLASGSALTSSASGDAQGKAGSVTSDGEPMDESASTPNADISGNRSSTPDNSFASAFPSDLPQAMEVSEEEEGEEGENDDDEQGNKDALKRSCAVLATTLTAYGDTANPTPSGCATPRASVASSSNAGSSSLLLDDSRGADVTRAAHLLVGVLRHSSACQVSESVPETTAMLEHAVEPLRRDDPKTHTRVKEIFSELGNIDAEISTFRKMLSEEETKRKQYHVDHCRRTHNYGPFISTFLVMLAKRGLLQQAIDEEHPQRQKRSNSISLASAGGSGQSAPKKKKAAATTSGTGTTTTTSTGARRGRPPGSKTKKKNGKPIKPSTGKQQQGRGANSHS